jgi:hypothetical protein
VGVVIVHYMEIPMPAPARFMNWPR